MIILYVVSASGISFCFFGQIRQLRETSPLFPPETRLSTSPQLLCGCHEHSERAAPVERGVTLGIVPMALPPGLSGTI